MADVLLAHTLTVFIDKIIRAKEKVQRLRSDRYSIITFKNKIFKKP